MQNRKSVKNNKHNGMRQITEKSDSNEEKTDTPLVQKNKDSEDSFGTDSSMLQVSLNSISMLDSNETDQKKRKAP
jgi:hypothetical protein